MTNQELIIKLTEDISWLEQGCETEREIVDHIKMAIEALASQQWIPCSERMPSEPFGCIVTVMDTEPMTQAEFPNLLPYFVGYDGKQWNDGDGEQCPFEVLAWMPLPKRWKGEQE